MKWQWYDSVFVVLFVYLFVFQVCAIWPFTIDDMFIPLRYAKHWSSGEGLLWNLHSPPVEGYSNFSFVVLGSLCIILNINPIVALKLMGVVGLSFTCLFIFFITRFWFKKRESLLPCIALLLYKGQIIWTASGLETTVYQALVCGAIYFMYKGLGYNFIPAARKTPHPSSLILAGVLLSLAAITRPEAPALIALLFILMLFDKPQFGIQEYRKGLAYFVITIFVLYMPYFLWHWHYYGRLFPNSVYCKGFRGLSFSLDVKYLKLIWPLGLLALIASVQATDKRHYFLWLPSVVYLSLLIGADPVVAFDNRLFLPAFVLLLPLALQGMRILILKYLRKEDWVYYLALYWFSFLVAFCVIPCMSLSEYRFFSQNPIAGEFLRNQVVQWLNMNVPQGKTVVLGDSGMIPYYSDLNFIDSYCLNNSKMSHYPIETRYEQFCHQILRDNPPVIILTSLIEHGQVTYTHSDLCLKNKLKNQSAYKLIKILSDNKNDSAYRYELFTNF